MKKGNKKRINSNDQNDSYKKMKQIGILYKVKFFSNIIDNDCFHHHTHFLPNHQYGTPRPKCAKKTLKPSFYIDIHVLYICLAIKHFFSLNTIFLGELKRFWETILNL